MYIKSKKKWNNEINESCYCGEDAVDKGSKSSSSLCIVMYFVPTVSCFNSAF